MTRCRVCDCKLKSGDICRRCEYEQDWRNTPEYFCTSSNCQKLLPEATEPGLCDACKKLAQIPHKPTANEEKPEEIMLTQKSKETCKICNHRLTKNGHCLSCARRGNSNRARGKKNPAPKTGAEEPLCNETAPFEPAANTIHAAPPPKPIIEIEESDVCRRAILQHGISRQLAKAAEEFSEAAAAISRFLAGEGEYTEIIGEVADVEVMCLQMRLIYGVDGIEQARAEKVARLHGRLTP